MLQNVTKVVVVVVTVILVWPCSFLGLATESTVQLWDWFLSCLGQWKSTESQSWFWGLMQMQIAVVLNNTWGEEMRDAIAPARRRNTVNNVTCSCARNRSQPRIWLFCHTPSKSSVRLHQLCPSSRSSFSSTPCSVKTDNQNGTDCWAACSSRK